MNILMIGNGFDIEHKLPTKYQDFLKWIIHEYNFYVYLNKQAADITQDIDIKLIIPEEINEEIKMNRMEKQIQRELWTLIDDNKWIELFLRNQHYLKENWIDFESEISRVIQSIDNDMQKCNADIYSDVTHISEPFFADCFLEDLDTKILDREAEIYQDIANKRRSVSEEAEYISKYMEEHPVEPKKDKITYKQLINRLENDLNKLIRALEIYLCKYLDKDNIVQSEIIKKIKTDHVLSFNYTDTFEKIYDNGQKIEYDYIHGKAEINNNIDTNNMVLGIDEYLSKKRSNKDVKFIAFKKYYQRIHKETGCKYKNWVDEIKYNLTDAEKVLKEKFKTQIPYGKFNKKHHLYIFGHSLDVTDKDILRDLILNDNVYTTIYYYNKKVYGQQIANLVKVIGKDELIRRTGGKTKTIDFVNQQLV